MKPQMEEKGRARTKKKKAETVTSNSEDGHPRGAVVNSSLYPDGDPS